MKEVRFLSAFYKLDSDSHTIFVLSDEADLLLLFIHFQLQSVLWDVSEKN